MTLTKSDMEKAARAMIEPLGHDPSKDWERTFIGGYGSPEPNDLASLCRALAQAAFRAVGIEVEDEQA